MSSETILGISPLHRRRKYFCPHLPLHESSCICLQDTEKLMSSLFLSSSSCKILRIKRNQTDSTFFSGEVSEQFTISWDSYISSRRDVVVAKVSSMLSLDTVYNIVRWATIFRYELKVCSWTFYLFLLYYQYLVGKHLNLIILLFGTSKG